MSPLLNVREFDDAELVELPSDSEDLLTLKFKERMRWKQEEKEREHCERERRE